MVSLRMVQERLLTCGKQVSRYFATRGHCEAPMSAIRCGWHAEIDRIGTSIEHQAKRVLLIFMDQTGELFFFRVDPVGQSSLWAKPMYLGVRVELLLAQNRMGTTKSNHPLGETVNFPVLLQKVPVNPTGFIVLTVGVVIAALRAAKFVASQQHRHPARDQLSQQEVFYLAFPDGLDLYISRLAFCAVVLAGVVVCPVMVIFSVCFIVLVAIAHQVVQSETVVAGDEIDAALGTFARLGVDVGTAADAAGKQTEHPIIAAPETPDIISVPAIPLRPTPF